MELQGNSAKDRFTEPVLSASLYSNLPLHSLIAAVIPVLTKELGLTDPASRFWFFRYAKPVPHIKVRIHLDHCDKQVAIYALESCFPRPSQTFSLSTSIASHLPSVDAEDDLLPNEPIVYTAYRRSIVCFTGGAWLYDAGYISASHEALCEGTHYLIRSGVYNNIDPIKKNVYKLFIGMMGIVVSRVIEDGLFEEYLNYHQGWVLRFYVSDVDVRDRMLAKFQSQRARSPLSKTEVEKIIGGIERYGLGNQFIYALEVLKAALNAHPATSGYLSDPYTSNITFNPVFKLLNLFANQLGLAPEEEAYLCLQLREALRLG